MPKRTTQPLMESTPPGAHSRKRRASRSSAFTPRNQSDESEEPVTSAGPTLTSDDFHQLIHMSSAGILCVSFPEPLRADLPPEEFAANVYAAPSCCVEANPQFTRLLGTSGVKTLRGEPLSQLLPSSRGFYGMIQEWSKRNLSGHPFEWETFDAQHRSQLLNAAIYGHLFAGKLDRVWFVLRDMSALRRAIKAVAKTETHYRELLNHGRIIFARLHRDGTLSFFTPYTAHILKIKDSEFATLDAILNELVAPTEKQKIDELAKHRISGTTAALNITIELQGESMERSRYDLSQVPHINTSGDLDYYDLVGVAVTIPEGDEGAMNLRKGSPSPALITAGLAHDVNNHLLVASANLQLANTLPHGQSSTAVNAALSALEQCSKIVSRLSDANHGTTPRPEAISIGGVLNEVASQFGPLLPKGLTIEVSKISPRLTAFADPAHLRQIIVNLVMNAREALGSSGSIVLSATTKAPSKRGQQEPADRFVCISVSDNGPGISPPLLHRLFEPFVSTKGSGKARGLGLTMVKTLIELNRGTVSVTSASRVGTTFTITVPASRETGPAQTKKAKMAAPSRPLSILIADDQPEIRDTLMTALVGRGHQVVAVPDGRSLAQALADRNLIFDLLVIDDGMPGSTGAMVIKNAREIAPGIPIILTSGDPSVRVTVKNSRSTTFLAKPFSLSAFFEAVEKAY